MNEFTESLFGHFQNIEIQRYSFIAVIDSIFQRQQSQEHLRMLEKLLERKYFKDRVVIYWMEAQINKQKLKHLGFT